MAKKLIKSCGGISDCTVVCGIKTKSTCPLAMCCSARRKQLVVEAPPALQMAISRHPLSPITSGILPNDMSFCIEGWAIGLLEITAPIRFLSMPASLIAPMHTSSKISHRLRSGSRRVGTSAIPTTAKPDFVIAFLPFLLCDPSLWRNAMRNLRASTPPYQPNRGYRPRSPRAACARRRYRGPWES